MMAEGLGGDAAAVEAGASHFRFFRNDYLQSVLGCIFSGTVSARARTNND